MVLRASSACRRSAASDAAIQHAFAHCQRMVRSADKDRFLAGLFAATDRRRPLYALYAFNLELAAVRERIREPLAGEVRLQWWHDVIVGVREEPGNPVALAVTAALRTLAVEAHPLVTLIEARRRDLYREAIATISELQTYACDTSSALIEASMHILGEPEQEHLQIAAPAGMVAAISGLLRTFAFDAGRGKTYVPQELLERHGARRADILAGRSTPELQQALIALAAEARSRLERLRPELSVLPEPLVAAVLPLALVPAYLRRLERSDYDPFRNFVDVPQWKKQWLLWRAARDPTRIAGTRNHKSEARTRKSQF